MARDRFKLILHIHFVVEAGLRVILSKRANILINKDIIKSVNHFHIN